MRRRAHWDAPPRVGRYTSLMNRALVAVALAAVTLVPAAAGADDSLCQPGVQCLRMVTIYGRAPKPMVVVELRHAPATSAAGQAHAEMRARWIQQLVPATLKR